jgi:hypothetical protein
VTIVVVVSLLLFVTGLAIGRSLVKYRAKRFLLPSSKREQESLKEEEEQRNMLQAMSAVDDDDNMASGSLQLGGEPKTQDNQW